jgi:hypothetical protein
MIPPTFIHAAVRESRRSRHTVSGIRRAHRQAKAHLVAGAGVLVVALVSAIVLAPPLVPTEADTLHEYVLANPQSLTVHADAAIPAVTRDGYTATLGIEGLSAGGTNHDWAKLVLLFGKWPMTDENVTVITRWMRQENGPDNWWNRNNPLNNGWGSGGGGGTGSYPSLVVAAENAAEALHTLGGYAPIAAALAASSPTEVTEQAIWASPWATGHYANGGHWSYAPVPAIKSPDGTW